MDLNKPKIVSLFSGAGGLDIGFRDAGFHTVFATDFWDKACETLRTNLISDEVIQEDIRKIDFSIIKHKYSSIEKFSITKTWTKSLQDSICNNLECMDKNIETDKELLTEAFKVYSIIKNKTDCIFFITPTPDGIVLSILSSADQEYIFTHVMEFEEDFIAKYDKPDTINLKLYLTDKICEEIFIIIDPSQKYKKYNAHLKDIYDKIEKCFHPVLPLEDKWMKNFVFTHLVLVEEQDIMKWLKEYK